MVKFICKLVSVIFLSSIYFGCGHALSTVGVTKIGTSENSIIVENLNDNYEVIFSKVVSIISKSGRIKNTDEKYGIINGISKGGHEISVHLDKNTGVVKYQCVVPPGYVDYPVGYTIDDCMNDLKYGLK